MQEDKPNTTRYELEEKEIIREQSRESLGVSAKREKEENPYQVPEA